MRRMDLFYTDHAEDPWNSTLRLRQELIRQAIVGPVPTIPDVELTSALVELAHYELKGFATGGCDLVHDDEEIQLILTTCQACCRRIRIVFPDLPFRNFTTFRRFWIRQGMSGSGSWAMRSDYLYDLFNPVEQALYERSISSWEDKLVDPIAARSEAGWAVVDQELDELRLRFSTARTQQDYCAIGAACVRVLEYSGEVAFDPRVHLIPGADSVPRDKTKIRFDAIIEVALPGPRNERLRKYARSLVELVQEVKHQPTSKAVEAGIAAEGVVVFSQMIRRLESATKSRQLAQTEALALKNGSVESMVS